MPLTPNNREEHWLQGMVDGSTTLTPNKRKEYWYKEIVDAIGSGGGGGTGGGALVVHEDADAALDKTWQEIADAFDNGSIIVLDFNNEEEGRVRYYLVAITNIHGVYSVKVRDFSDNVDIVYSTNSASGYPVYTE